MTEKRNRSHGTHVKVWHKPAPTCFSERRATKKTKQAILTTIALAVFRQKARCADTAARWDVAIIGRGNQLNMRAALVVRRSVNLKKQRDVRTSITMHFQTPGSRGEYAARAASEIAKGPDAPASAQIGQHSDEGSRAHCASAEINVAVQN